MYNNIPILVEENKNIVIFILVNSNYYNRYYVLWLFKIAIIIIFINSNDPDTHCEQFS